MSERGSKRPNNQKRDDGPKTVTLKQLQEMKFQLPGTRPQGMDFVVIIKGGTNTMEMGWTSQSIRPEAIPDMGRLAQLTSVVRGTSKEVERIGDIPRLLCLLFSAAESLPAISVNEGTRAVLYSIYSAYNYAANLALIDKHRNFEQDSVIKPFLMDQGQRIGHFFELWLRHAVQTSRTPFERDTQLIKLGISSFVYSWFTRSQFTRSFGTVSLFQHIFPARLENGLRLTTAELQSKEVRGTHQFLLAQNQVIVQWVHHPNFWNLFHSLDSTAANFETEKARAAQYQWVLLPPLAGREIFQTRRFSHQSRTKFFDLVIGANEFFIDLCLGMAPIGVPPTEFIQLVFSGELDEASSTSLFDQVVGSDPSEVVTIPGRPSSLMDALDMGLPVPSRQLEMLVKNVAVPAAFAGTCPKHRLAEHEPKMEGGRYIVDRTVSRWVEKNPQLRSLMECQKAYGNGFRGLYP